MRKGVNDKDQSLAEYKSSRGIDSTYQLHRCVLELWIRAVLLLMMPGTVTGAFGDGKYVENHRCEERRPRSNSQITSQEGSRRAEQLAYQENHAKATQACSTAYAPPIL